MWPPQRAICILTKEICQNEESWCDLSKWREGIVDERDEPRCNIFFSLMPQHIWAVSQNQRARGDSLKGVAVSLLLWQRRGSWRKATPHSCTNPSEVLNWRTSGTILCRKGQKMDNEWSSSEGGKIPTPCKNALYWMWPSWIYFEGVLELSDHDISLNLYLGYQGRCS